jgi:transglutaminase-like putative cysteine protease/LysM repeat protein
MKFTKLYLTLFLGFISNVVLSQEIQLASFLIPQELKEDANAVIRDESTVIRITAINQMSVKVSRTITVLNKIGRGYVDAFVGYDNDTKIVGLSAEIYDALGKRLKKVKKKDFLDFSAVDGGTLYSDNRVKQLEYTPTTYPYTVKFDYEYETSSTGFIPRWRPMDWFYIGVQKSSYKIINSTGIKLRQKKVNLDKFSVEDLSQGHVINYIMKDQKPLEYERNTKSFVELTPMLYVALDDFALKGVKGKATNWSEFGKWMNNKLLEGRDVLDAATVENIKKMVAHTNDPVEKAKIVYKFMQDKTRYISVQVGIGGWEPIAANQVDKVGYGDCKGLTNYTKALLDAVGVTSYYTVVYAKNRKDIDKDFTSMQGNHVILNIPNEGEDVWLECTSQIMPFGFLGDFTDDRNVLVITPEGGVIKRTPAYLNEFNLQTINADVALDVEGNVKAAVVIRSEGIKYDNRFHLESLSNQELKKQYKTDIWSYNNNLTIHKMNLSNDKDSIVFTEKISMDVQNYATTQQGAYLFRANVFNKNSYVPKRYRNRKLPLQISRGFKDVNEFTIKLPAGYVLEALPSDYILENKFGSYKVVFKALEDGSILYKRALLIKAGDYPKEDYKPYRSFRKKIAKYDNLRLSLIKKS